MTVVITWSPPSTNLSPYGIPIKSPPPRLSVAAGVAERASFRRKRPSGELQGPSGVSKPFWSYMAVRWPSTGDSGGQQSRAL